MKLGSCVRRIPLRLLEAAALLYLATLLLWSHSESSAINVRVREHVDLSINQRLDADHASDMARVLMQERISGRVRVKETRRVNMH